MLVAMPPAASPENLPGQQDGQGSTPVERRDERAADFGYRTGNESDQGGHGHGEADRETDRGTGKKHEAVDADRPALRRRVSGAWVGIRPGRVPGTPRGPPAEIAEIGRAVRVEVGASGQVLQHEEAAPAISPSPRLSCRP